MVVIIRLQNLAWEAKSIDIREFFQGLNIPNGGVHIIGGAQGDAFITFSTDEDARLAMLKTGGTIKGKSVTLLLSSRTEMLKIIETLRQELSLQRMAQFTPPTQQEPPAATYTIPQPEEKPVIETPKSSVQPEWFERKGSNDEERFSSHKMVPKEKDSVRSSLGWQPGEGDVSQIASNWQIGRDRFSGNVANSPDWTRDSKHEVVSQTVPDWSPQVKDTFPSIAQNTQHLQRDMPTTVESLTAWQKNEDTAVIAIAPEIPKWGEGEKTADSQSLASWLKDKDVKNIQSDWQRDKDVKNMQSDWHTDKDMSFSAKPPRMWEAGKELTSQTGPPTWRREGPVDVNMHCQSDRDVNVNRNRPDWEREKDMNIAKWQRDDVPSWEKDKDTNSMLSSGPPFMWQKDKDVDIVPKSPATWQRPSENMQSMPPNWERERDNPIAKNSPNWQKEKDFVGSVAGPNWQRDIDQNAFQNPTWERDKAPNVIPLAPPPNWQIDSSPNAIPLGTPNWSRDYAPIAMQTSVPSRQSDATSNSMQLGLPSARQIDQTPNSIQSGPVTRQIDQNLNTTQSIPPIRQPDHSKNSLHLGPTGRQVDNFPDTMQSRPPNRQVDQNPNILQLGPTGRHMIQNLNSMQLGPTVRDQNLNSIHSGPPVRQVEQNLNSMQSRPPVRQMDQNMNSMQSGPPNRQMEQNPNSMQSRPPIRHMDQNVNSMQSGPPIRQIDQNPNTMQSRPARQMDQNLNSMQSGPPIRQLEQNPNSMQSRPPVRQMDQNLNSMQSGPPIRQMEQNPNSMQSRPPVRQIDQNLNSMQSGPPIRQIEQSPSSMQSRSSIRQMDQNVNNMQSGPPIRQVDQNPNNTQLRPPPILSMDHNLNSIQSGPPIRLSEQIPSNMNWQRDHVPLSGPQNRQREQFSSAMQSAPTNWPRDQPPPGIPSSNLNWPRDTLHTGLLGRQRDQPSQGPPGNIQRSQPPSALPSNRPTPGIMPPGQMNWQRDRESAPNVQSWQPDKPQNIAENTLAWQRDKDTHAAHNIPMWQKDRNHEENRPNWKKGKDAGIMENNPSWKKETDPYVQRNPLTWKKDFEDNERCLAWNKDGNNVDGDLDIRSNILQKDKHSHDSSSRIAPYKPKERGPSPPSRQRESSRYGDRDNRSSGGSNRYKDRRRRSNRSRSHSRKATRSRSRSRGRHGRDKYRDKERSRKEDRRAKEIRDKLYGKDVKEQKKSDESDQSTDNKKSKEVITKVSNAVPPVNQESTPENQQSTSGNQESTSGNQESTSGNEPQEKNEESSYTKDPKEALKTPIGLGTSVEGAKKAVDSKGTSNFCIEIRNIPNDGYDHVKSILKTNGVNVPPDGMKVISDTKGNPVGIAYIKFLNTDEKVKVLKLNSIKINDTVLEILELDNNIFDKAVDSFKPNTINTNQETIKTHENVNKDNIAGVPEPKPLWGSEYPFNWVELPPKNEASTCLVVRDFPCTASGCNLTNFFKDFKVKDSFIAPDLKNSENVIGFIKFSSERDQSKALQSKVRYIDGKKVNIEPCSEEEFTVAKERTTLKKENEDSVVLKSDCIKLQGMPPRVNDRDILAFLREADVVPTQIHLLLDKDGKPVGEGYAEFALCEEASLAIKRNQCKLKQNAVSVSLVLREEMSNALSITTPITPSLVQEDCKTKLKDVVDSKINPVGTVEKLTGTNEVPGLKAEKLPALKVELTPEFNTLAEQATRYAAQALGDTDTRNKVEPLKANTFEDKFFDDAGECSYPHYDHTAIPFHHQPSGMQPPQFRPAYSGPRQLMPFNAPFRGNHNQTRSPFGPSVGYNQMPSMGPQFQRERFPNTRGNFRKPDHRAPTGPPPDHEGPPPKRALLSTPSRGNRPPTGHSSRGRRFPLNSRPILRGHPQLEDLYDEFQPPESPKHIHPQYRENPEEETDMRVEMFGEPGCVLAMENVPFRAEVDEIIEFFGGFDVKHEDVIRRFDPKGHPTGDARVRFISRREAQRALRSLSHKAMRHRPVLLSLVE